MMMVADDLRWIQISLGWQGLQGPDIEFKTRAAQFIVLVPLKAISVIDLGRVHLKRRRTADTVHREELIISKLWTESAWMNWMALWWKTGNLHLGWPCCDPDMFTFIEKKLRETERGRERHRAWQVIAGGNQGCVKKGGDLWHFSCARRVQQSNTQWPWGLSQTNYFSMLVLADKWTCTHWTHAYTFQSSIMRLRGARVI